MEDKDIITELQKEREKRSLSTAVEALREIVHLGRLRSHNMYFEGKMYEVAKEALRFIERERRREKYGL